VAHLAAASAAEAGMALEVEERANLEASGAEVGRPWYRRNFYANLIILSFAWQLLLQTMSTE
jgi:hypothetical protein